MAACTSRRKDAPGVSNGTVRIREWVANPYDPFEPENYVNMNSESQMGAVTSVSGYDSDFTVGYDDDGDGNFTGP